MHLVRGQDSGKSDHNWGAVDIEGWCPGDMHCLLLEEGIAWIEEGHMTRCFGRQDQDCSMSRLLHPFFAPWPIGKIVDYYCFTEYLYLTESYDVMTRDQDLICSEKTMGGTLRLH